MWLSRADQKWQCSMVHALCMPDK